MFCCFFNTGVLSESDEEWQAWYESDAFRNMTKLKFQQQDEFTCSDTSKEFYVCPFPWVGEWTEEEYNNSFILLHRNF